MSTIRNEPGPRGAPASFIATLSATSLWTTTRMLARAAQLELPVMIDRLPFMLVVDIDNAAAADFPRR